MIITAPTLDGSLADLPPETEKFLAQVREFAQEVVLPRALALEETQAERFDWDLVRQGHELGLTRMGVPKRFGGLGLGAVAVALATEELAAADPGVTLIFGCTGLFHTAVLLSGDARLQEKFLPLFTGPDPVIGCGVLTEELAGVDLVLPESSAHARMETTARREGDHYVLNGRKRFITNGPIANYGFVLANLEGHPGATGLTCFAVHLDQPGVRRGPVTTKMGYKNSLSGDVIFENVRVPAEDVIGGEAGGWTTNLVHSNMSRVICAALGTGIARHALDLALRWADDRVQGGKVLREHQFTAGKIAQMAAKVHASRLTYLHAARKVENRLPAPEYEPAIAKLIADRTALDVAEIATSLYGARGYVRDHGMEKVLRDSFGPRIYLGTPEALALLITKDIYESAE